jgi:hypothetical protein
MKEALYSPFGANWPTSTCAALSPARHQASQNRRSQTVSAAAGLAEDQDYPSSG